MKHSIFVVIFGLLTQAVSVPAEPNQKLLKNVSFKLKTELRQTHKYKWEAVTQKGGKRESKDFAVLIISTKLDSGTVLLNDTITLTPANGDTVFERRMKFQKDNLLRPEEITLDISARGQKVRQLSYEKGEAKFIEFSGATNTERWAFEDGILSFNALLRLAPALPRNIGDVYTFQTYAEPFLFRIKNAEKKADRFTLACEASETIKIGKKSHECVRFRLELKSAEVRTDIWVDKRSLVVKFVDTLPEGADAEFLEATLQE